MKFTIGGFTHKGTGIYQSNEDNMLINGFQSNDGMHFVHDAAECICFVSDGVGGNSAGDFASAFIIAKIKNAALEQLANLKEYLETANEELIAISTQDNTMRGCACTLSGIIINSEFQNIIHVGDSEIWLFRDEMFYKITQDEVLDPDDWHSPITNYFGSTKNNLKIKTSYTYPSPAQGDIFVICSDGLFKSLKSKVVKPIISAEISIEEKVQQLHDACLIAGAEDNVTAIIVELLL
ncbi:MAG TPA: serine/threonine-protein phosphatase [Bacteroidales bacterium]|nr:serine/threonine-protein phosphatase [Bacteroidales bacterium]